MNPSIRQALQKVDTRGWKEIPMEYGSETLVIRVPPHCDILTMKPIPLLADPQKAYEEALAHPIGSATLGEIIRSKGKAAQEIKVALTISDITRPVPYRGEEGLLPPLLRRLESSGILRGNIVIVIGNGMHRPSTLAERIEILGEDILGRYTVVDHDCEDLESLTFIGKSATGGDVFVNTVYYQADLRIATGLVESHFMAGVSGGRKAVCPGLVDKRTIEKFHSPAFLESPRADNLILEGNPCHEEALAIARTVGVDFIVNTTLDKDLRLTGVFAGHIESAHAAAAERVRSYVTVPLAQEYDIVLTHGGFVGRNHYQAVKAAYNALPAVRKGGTLIVAADNRDAEPIGGPEYRSLLHLLKVQGGDHFLKMIETPGWRFTKDQWEPEMWAKVFRKIAEKNFVYCTHAIPRQDYCMIPGCCGLDFLPQEEGLSATVVKEMVENALQFALSQARSAGSEPTVAFLREGPYAIPFLRGTEAFPG